MTHRSVDCAMTHRSVDCAMTTEPTVSQLLANKQAHIPLDIRTTAGATQALGGEYPATSFYPSKTDVQQNPATAQKLVNAFVKTMEWIQSHTAAQSTDQMPPDYYSGVGKDAYTKALESEKGIYKPTGLMPPSGPATAGFRTRRYRRHQGGARWFKGQLRSARHPAMAPWLPT